MVAFSPAESLSLIEIVILGFMAANVSLVGGFVIQRGVKRLSDTRAQR